MEKSYATSYAELRCEKANLACGRNPDKHSLDGVGILKRATDMADKYLIYKKNSSQFNHYPDYLFKTSPMVPQIAVDMGQVGPENPLQSKEVYFDASHLCCIHHKTLALFVYHLAVWCILRIGTMEVKSEYMRKQLLLEIDG